MILRCTKKLLEVLRPAQMAAPEPDDDDWYANLLWFDRRKCLLLTHVATLFTVFEPDIRTANLRPVHPLVTYLIERELRAEGLPSEAFGDLRSGPFILAKTADRSVVGCMNDMAFLCDHHVFEAGSLADMDLRTLNHRLHRNINSSRDYHRPIDLVSARVAASGARAPDRRGRGQGTRCAPLRGG